jgi:transcriptional regulator with XRE-family HTH domain
MKFTEVVRILINGRGINRNKMLKDLGMGTGTFTTWERRGTIPSAETVLKIAEYFNVSVDYILGKTDIKNKPAVDNGEPISNHYVNVLKKYEALSPEQRKLVDAFTDALIAGNQGSNK